MFSVEIFANMTCRLDDVFNQNNKFQKMTLRQATAYYQILEKYCIVEIIL